MTKKPRRALVALLLVAMAACLRAQTGDAVAGSKIFSTNCSGCHGSDGRGGERAPNIATARNIVSLSDGDLGGFIRNGVTGSGMPAFGFLGDNGIRDVVAYLRQLQGKTSETVHLPGDADAGRLLFFGQAGCSTCHMMQGEGGYIASDLSDYASGIPLDRIRSAIVDPPASVPAGSQVVEFVTQTGEPVTGVLRSENNFTIIVQMQDGRYRNFAKSSLKKMNYTGRTLMPADYGTRLSAKQMDDVLSYLVRSANSIDPATRNKKRGAR